MRRRQMVMRKLPLMRMATPTVTLMLRRGALTVRMACRTCTAPHSTHL